MYDRHFPPMTEAAWLDPAETNPSKLLMYLACKPEDRKARLFAVACCRSIWQLLPDERCRQAVEVAERYADGLATEADWEQAYDDANAAANDLHVDDDEDDEASPEAQAAGEAAGAVEAAVARHAVGGIAFGVSAAGDARNAAAAAARRDEPTNSQAGRAAFDAESRRQCHLVRDIFGNPFRPLTFDPTWRTSAVVNLAQAIYDDRAFERLPLLADALEDAGCHDADILRHCRGPGSHVCGCWVVDILLEKA